MTATDQLIQHENKKGEHKNDPLLKTLDNYAALKFYAGCLISLSRLKTIKIRID